MSKKNSDNHIDDHNDYVDTNLIPEAFANSQKIISTDKRWYADSNEDVVMDENLDDHHTKNSNKHYQSEKDNNDNKKSSHDDREFNNDNLENCVF